jgi:hypothetical protein
MNAGYLHDKSIVTDDIDDGSGEKILVYDEDNKIWVVRPVSSLGGSGVGPTGSMGPTGPSGAGDLLDGDVLAPGLKFLDDTDTGLFRPDDDTMAFSVGGKEAMRISKAPQNLPQIYMPLVDTAEDIVQTGVWSDEGGILFSEVSDGVKTITGLSLDGIDDRIYYNGDVIGFEGPDLSLGFWINPHSVEGTIMEFKDIDTGDTILLEMTSANILKYSMVVQVAGVDPVLDYHLPLSLTTMSDEIINTETWAQSGGVSFSNVDAFETAVFDGVDDSIIKTDTNMIVDFDEPAFSVGFWIKQSAASGTITEFSHKKLGRSIKMTLDGSNNLIYEYISGVQHNYWNNYLPFVDDAIDFQTGLEWTFERPNSASATPPFQTEAVFELKDDGNKKFNALHLINDVSGFEQGFRYMKSPSALGTPTSAMSYGFWMYVEKEGIVLTSTDGVRGRDIIQFDNGGVSLQYIHTNAVGTELIKWNIDYDGIYGFGSFYNKWTHVHIGINSFGSKCFINGVDVTSSITQLTGTKFTPYSPFDIQEIRLGCGATAFADDWAGYLHDVYIGKDKTITSSSAMACIPTVSRQVPIPDNQWVHITMTSNYDTGNKLYIDGVLYDTSLGYSIGQDFFGMAGRFIDTISIGSDNCDENHLTACIRDFKSSNNTWSQLNVNAVAGLSSDTAYICRELTIPADTWTNIVIQGNAFGNQAFIDGVHSGTAGYLIGDFDTPYQGIDVDTLSIGAKSDATDFTSVDVNNFAVSNSFWTTEQITNFYTTNYTDDFVCQIQTENLSVSSLSGLGDTWTPVLSNITNWLDTSIIIDGGYYVQLGNMVQGIFKIRSIGIYPEYAPRTFEFTVPVASTSVMTGGGSGYATLSGTPYSETPYLNIELYPSSNNTMLCRAIGAYDSGFTDYIDLTITFQYFIN